MFGKYCILASSIARLIPLLTFVPCVHRIGLNDIAAEGTFVWSDEEPLGYSNWVSSQPDGQAEPGVDADGIYMEVGRNSRWADWRVEYTMPYICARKSTPTAATGGEMLGCAGGRWVLGAPYKQPTSTRRRLPPTIVCA